MVAQISAGRITAGFITHPMDVYEAVDQRRREILGVAQTYPKERATLPPCSSRGPVLQCSLSALARRPHPGPMLPPVQVRERAAIYSRSW